MSKGIWTELPSPFKEEVIEVANLLKADKMLGDRRLIEFHVGGKQIYGPSLAEADRLLSAKQDRR